MRIRDISFIPSNQVQIKKFQVMLIPSSNILVFFQDVDSYSSSGQPMDNEKENVEQGPYLSTSFPFEL
ncbi:hypothetical protein HNY73_008096 [Argiope bruennichi]|uniref:Uncharacterized protein n=1 Tax=Argiope bruennichi TaxID=94029 RepID=A0A8T0F826_ARGBR|nr:hypothetical protein HNY73_008096 [Argiope bruennichi]